MLSAATPMVGECALKGAGGAVAIVLAVDGSVICYRCAKGELTPLQTQQAAAETVAKAGAVGAATYVAVVLGANPVGFTVIVVGGVVYLIADYAIDELRPSYTTTPLTVAQLDELMPPGWRREMP